MSVPLAIALKDLKLLFRDKANAFFTFVFPVIVAIFFGLLFGGGDTQPLDLLVLDESKSAQSAAMIKDLQDDPILKAQQVESRALGESTVRQGKALACIVLPTDFAKGADAMFSGGGMKVEVIIDPSRKQEGNLLVGKLNELAFKQLSRSFSNPDQMKRMLDQSRASVRDAEGLAITDRLVLEGLFSSLEKLSERTAAPDNPLKNGGPLQEGGWTPVKVEMTEVAENPNMPRSSYALTFPQGIAWVLMSSIAAFSASIARERARGTLLRLSVAPVSRGSLLFGKALGCFLACAMGIILLLIVSRFFKGVTFGNLPLLVVAVIAASASAAGVMMVISGIFRTEGAAEGAGRAIVLILAMIGGGTVPLFVMPSFMRIVSSFSPFKWSIVAVEGAMWRGFSVAEMAQPVGVLLGLTLAGAIAGWLSVRRAEA